jgi:MFS family permease
MECDTISNKTSNSAES